MTAISFKNVSKWFDDFQVLKNINLTVKEGEKIVICGPSGSGKSTLIRCINFLEPYQKGELKVYKDVIHSTTKNKTTILENIGMCFQQFNLFPHLTVLENCTLALVHVKKIHPTDAKHIALKNLEKVQIKEHANRYPNQLSGGQQQRVAIARSLCMSPKIMLFDEPTSALDPEMIKEVLEVMIELAKEGMTMICVTHEMGFAKKVADHIAFMDNGEILEYTSPDEFFTNPNNERSREFLSKILYS